MQIKGHLALDKADIEVSAKSEPPPPRLDFRPKQMKSL